MRFVGRTNVRTLVAIYMQVSCHSRFRLIHAKRFLLAMGIVSDLVFAIMPMFFIWQMNRPVIERMLITVLMALGIVAAMAGALKIVYMSRFVLGHGDVLRQMMPLFLWFKVEEFVLAASACAPFLKAPIERTLSRFGIQKFQFVTPSLIECRQPASLISEAATDHTTKDKSAAEG